MNSWSGVRKRIESERKPTTRFVTERRLNLRYCANEPKKLLGIKMPMRGGLMKHWLTWKRGVASRVSTLHIHKHRGIGRNEDIFALTLYHTGDGSVMLELVEGLLQHVLGVNLLHTQQVQDHVIGEVEGAVQRVGRTLLSRKESRENGENAGLFNNRQSLYGIPF